MSTTTTRENPGGPRDIVEGALIDAVYRCDQIAQTGKRVPTNDLLRLRRALAEVLEMRGER